jgi:hypothetical protein
MEQQSHDRVVGASRAASAVDWARGALQAAGQSSAAAAAGVDQTPAAVLVLEDVRARASVREAACTAAAADARARAAVYDMRADAAACAGGKLRERVDGGAVADAEALAVLAAALEVPIAVAASGEADRAEGVFAAALGRVAARAACAMTEADVREAEAGLAATRVRQAAGELRRACAAREEATETLRYAEDHGAEDMRKAETMEAKANQYAEAAAEALDEVRLSGITADRTHETIADASQDVLNAEEECRLLDQRLAAFHDLPLVP